MKKTIGVALLLLSLILCLVLPAHATGFEATVDPSATSAGVDDQISFTISVSGADLATSGSIELSYDKDVFDIVSGKWLPTENVATKTFNKTKLQGAIAFADIEDTGDPLPTDLNGSYFTFKLQVKAAFAGEKTVTAAVQLKNGSTVVGAGNANATVTFACATHTWGDWTQTTAPTCAAKGVETHTCTVCGKSENRDVAIDPTAHAWNDWTQTTAPTCAAKGVETRTCKNDSSHVENRDVAIDPTAHAWGAWTVTTQPTCVAKGVETRTCTNDPSHVENRDVAIDPAAHTWGAWTVTTAPTCTAKGVETRTCTGCGKSENRDVAIDPTAHAWNDWTQTTAPTCAAKGVETRTCKNDPSHVENRDVAIDPTAHAWNDWTQTTAPTCAAKGVETRTCKNDPSHVENRDVAIDPTAHTWGAWTVTTAPTCTAKGVETRTCTGCGKSENRDVAIDPAAHVWGAWEETTPATCEEKGEERHTCSACGVKENRDIDPLGHDWGEWTVTKPATASEDGEESRTCKNDSSHTESRVIYTIKGTEESGTQFQWVKGSTGGAVFTSTAAYGKFQGVQVDGVDVDPANYTVDATSGAVTLKPAFLQTLAAGDHNVTIVSDDGQATAPITITAPAASTGDSNSATSPQTSDNSHIGVIAVVMFASLAGIAALVVERKKTARR